MIYVMRDGLERNVDKGHGHEAQERYIMDYATMVVVNDCTNKRMFG